MKKKLFIFSGILLLLTGGIKWAWNLPLFMDVTFGDEAQYLRYGLDLFSSLHKDWGPSYNLWYKLLSLFQSNPVKLFYLNYQITSVLITLLLFVFLIRYNISFIISLWLSFCFLFTTTVIDTWPRVSHFAVIILLTALIIVRNISSTAKKLLIITFTFYVAAYARPELFSSFVLICLVTLYVLYKNRSSYKNWMPLAILFLIIILIHFSVYQFPANYYKGIDRTYIAFSQHYAINYVIEHKGGFNPVSEWIDFAKKEFTDCSTFGCIIKNHLNLVFHNSVLNFKNYVFVLMQFITGILFPAMIIRKHVLHLIVFIMFLLMIVFVLFHKPSRNSFTGKIKEHQLLLIILFLFGLPSIGTSVLIFPRQHYLIMHSILILFVIALMIDSLFIIKKFHPAFVLSLCGILLFKSPDASKYNYYQSNRENKNQCNKELINYLTASNNYKKHVVFSNHLSLSMMLPENFNDFNTEYEYKPGMQFSNILSEKKIDYILVRDILMQEKLLNSDTSWINFMQNPEKYNFRKEVYCDSCESYLLIKSE